MENLSRNKDIGRRIKLLREKLRISKERLGELLGVSYQQVQKYEKGVNKVSAERLYRIAQALNVPLDFFFEGRKESRYAQLPHNKMLPKDA
jgi:transcriptional regulator with XRE-family HTH domain